MDWQQICVFSETHLHKAKSNASQSVRLKEQQRVTTVAHTAAPTGAGEGL